MPSNTTTTETSFAMDKFKSRTFVDRKGSNYTFAQATAIVMRATGATERVLEYLRPGDIYKNGPWFQRID